MKIGTEARRWFWALPLTWMSAACQRRVSGVSAAVSAAMSAAKLASGSRSHAILGVW